VLRYSSVVVEEGAIVWVAKYRKDGVVFYIIDYLMGVAF
jgi:hypothetical protein